MKYLKHFRQKSVYLPSIAAVVVLAGAYFYFFGSDEPELVTANALRGNLVQIVSVTGRVKPAESVNLAFEKGGRVAWKNAEVGDKIFAGQSADDDLHDAFTKSDDAVRNKVDQFISNPTSSSPQLNFTVSDANLESDIEWERIGFESMLNSWEDNVIYI